MPEKQSNNPKRRHPAKQGKCRCNGKCQNCKCDRASESDLPALD